MLIDTVNFFWEREREIDKDASANLPAHPANTFSSWAGQETRTQPGTPAGVAGTTGYSELSPATFQWGTLAGMGSQEAELGQQRGHSEVGVGVLTAVFTAVSSQHPGSHFGGQFVRMYSNLRCIYLGSLPRARAWGPLAGAGGSKQVVVHPRAALPVALRNWAGLSGRFCGAPSRRQSQLLARTPTSQAPLV